MRCKHPKPVNTKLYNSIKKRVKKRVKRWPSAYASGQLVRTYKRRGGKYRCVSFGSLDRWFKERWVNVCERKNGKYKKCARGKGKYPYCRPLKRINSNTPKTAGELSRSEIKRRCSKKNIIKKKTLRFGTIHYLKGLI